MLPIIFIEGGGKEIILSILALPSSKTISLFQLGSDRQLSSVFAGVQAIMVL